MPFARPISFANLRTGFELQLSLPTQSSANGVPGIGQNPQKEADLFVDGLSGRLFLQSIRLVVEDRLLGYRHAVRFWLTGEHKVSFVAVTQQFNTSTSLGRLTLNILLSFAQFERELIGERTRDKMSAARRRAAPSLRS